MTSYQWDYSKSTWANEAAKHAHESKTYRPEHRFTEGTTSAQRRAALAPTVQQIRSDYDRGWRASRDGTELEPRNSLDAFDAGYEDESTGSPKYTNLPTVDPWCDPRDFDSRNRGL